MIWLIQDIQLWVRMFRLWSAVDYLTPGARVKSVCHSMANLYRTGHTASHLFMKVTHLCLSARTRYWNLSIVALLWRNDEVDGDRMWKGRNNLSLVDQWLVGLDFHHHRSTNSQEWELLSRIPHFRDEQYFAVKKSFANGAHCVQGLKYCRHCVINV